MSEPQPELLILAVTLVALALAPLASRLVSRIGEQISSELDMGLTGQALSEHLDATTDSSAADEIRQVVIASNERRARAGEPLLDVEAEVARVLRELG